MNRETAIVVRALEGNADLIGKDAAYIEQYVMIDLLAPDELYEAFDRAIVARYDRIDFAEVARRLNGGN